MRTRTKWKLVLSMALVGGGCAEPPQPAGRGSGPAVAAAVTGSAELRGQWLSAGNGIDNARNQRLEREVGPDNAARLGVKWWFETDGDVWTTAAVDAQTVYFPDAKGSLYALERETGKVRWKRKVSEYTGVPDVISRTTPAVVGDVLYMGDQGGRTGQGASVFAVDKNSGQKLWSTKVDPTPPAVITMSPIVHEGVVYVGVSSSEEMFAAQVAGYKCCSFRGSMLALDARNGEILWQTYVTPQLPGFSGVAIWSSTPVIDEKRGSVYITTGNNYTVPTAILDCQSLPTPDEVAACVAEVPGSEDNHFDAMISLDMASGKIKWARSMVPFDAWNIACIFAVPGNEGNCSDPHGEDYDFGNGAILYTARVEGVERELLGAGQKSGVFWALNPDNGDVVWKTQVGPGGGLGGLEWGSAYDGKRIYTAVANSNVKPYTLPSGETITSGSWAALDPATGEILWQTRGVPAVQTTNQGPVSVANGVMYAGTIDAAGTMYALNAATGETLWSYASGGSVNTSPAIVDGTLYWGSGYGVTGFGITPNNRFFAFAVGANNPPPPKDGGPPGASGPIDHGGSVPDASVAGVPTWTQLFERYLGPGTTGHCSNCHVEMLTAASAHVWLTGLGQVGGVSSPLAVRGQSRLTWFGGTMPPMGPTTLEDAERAFADWVAAGAAAN